MLRKLYKFRFKVFIAKSIVVCLLSALAFYEITTQIPHEVWLVVPRGSWKPIVDYPPLSLTYVSGNAYSFGIDQR